MPFSRDELDYIDQQDAIRKTARQTALRASPLVAGRVSSLAAAYPGISPGLAYSLGSAGYSVSPVAQELWQKELASRINNTPGTKKKASKKDDGGDGVLGDLWNAVTYVPRKVHEGVGEGADVVAEGTGAALKGIGHGIGATYSALKGAQSEAEQRTGVPGVAGPSNQFQPAKPAIREIATTAQSGIEAGVAATRQLARQELSRPAVPGPPEAIHEAFNQATGLNKQPITPPPSSIGGALSEIEQQTTLGQQIFHGQSVGTGYIPDLQSPAAVAQAEAARQFSPYTIGGHAWTPGRAIAYTVAEPDDDAFKIASGIIDAGVALKADPANLALSAVSEYRGALRTIVPDAQFTNEAVATTNRWHFLPTPWSVEKARPEAQMTFNAIAAESDPFWIARSTNLPISTEKDPFFLQHLSEAKTNEQVAGIIEDNLAELREGVRWKTPSTRFERWRTDIPSIGKPISTGVDADINETAAQVDRWLVNNRFTTDERAASFNKIVKANGNLSRQDMLMQHLMDLIGQGAARHGASEETVNAVREAFGREYTILKEVNEEAIGDLRLFRPEVVQHSMTSTAVGDAVTEKALFHDTVYLPDPKQFRREISEINTKIGVLKTNEVLSSPAYSNLVQGTDTFMNFWRRAILARPATGLRVTGEEQFRIAAYGLASIVHHPMTALSFALGNPDDRWIEALARSPITMPMGAALADFKATYGRTPTKLFLPGELGVDNPLKDALYDRWGALTGSRETLHGFENIHPLENLDPHLAHVAPVGLAENLMQAREDPIYQHLLEHGLEATKRAFWDGTLKDRRLLIATVPQKAALGNDPSVADAYITDYANSLNNITGGNPKLERAMQTGTIEGHRIFDGAKSVRRSARKAFSDIIDNEVAFKKANPDQAMLLPDTIPIAKTHTQSASQRLAGIRHLDNTLNYFIDAFLTRPSNYFSRNVMSQQIFQESMYDLFPSMSTSDRARVLSHMGPGDANLSAKVQERFTDLDLKLRRIEKVNPATVRVGTVTAGDISTRYTAAFTKAQQYPAVHDLELNVSHLEDTAGSVVKRVAPSNPALGPLIDEYETALGHAATGEALPPYATQRGYQSAEQWADDVLKRAQLEVTGAKAKRELATARKELQSARETLATATANPNYAKEGRAARTAAEKIAAEKPRDVFAGTPFPTKAELEAKAKAGLSPMTPTLSYEQAGHIAAKRAMDETKDLLYDLSKKSQGMDMLRVLMPFGEAFKEVITRWAKLTWENPQVLRRLQQGLYAARQPGSNVLYTATGGVAPRNAAGEEQGFFYKDSYGQEVFAYPGSELLTKELFGVPIPLKGSVQGLNMVGNGLPGIGPLVQAPLSYFLPDKPQFDDLRKLLFPYGTPPLTGLFPGWLRTGGKGLSAIFRDPGTDRTFASTTFDAAKYLVSTGKYDLQGPNAQEHMAQLMEDAKGAAKSLYFVKMFGQLGAPASPNPEWLAFDKKGNLTLLSAMSQWYQRQVQTAGAEQAYTDFLNIFGTKNFLVPQPKSAALIPRAPITADQYDWSRTHPEFRRSYPKAYGLFAPPDKTPTLDQAAYQAQFEHGEREALSVDNMLRLANNRLANMAYDRFKIQFGSKISAQEEAALREYRTILTEQFPGYGTSPSFTPKSQLIEELQRAARDDRLNHNPAIDPLRQYLAQRQQALDAIAASHVPNITFKSTRATSISDKLRFIGETLVDKYPAFQNMWDSVFKGELRAVEVPSG